MTWHSVKGARFSVNGAKSDDATTSSRSDAKLYTAMVLDIHLGGMGTGESNFAEHVAISGMKVAMAGYVSSDGGSEAKGRMRIYFDPGVPQELRDRTDLVPGIRENLNRFFMGRRGTTFSQFRNVEFLDSQEAAIIVSIHPDEELYTVTVGDLGRLEMKPTRGSNGEFVRVLNEGPEYRDNIIVAIDQKHTSFWNDPDSGSWRGDGTAEMSDFNWRWNALPDETIHKQTHSYR